MKTKQDFISIAGLVNTVRNENKGNVFTTKELEDKLKDILPVNCLAKALLVKCNIVVRIQKGKYCFPENPIHWKSIENFYEGYRQRQRSYSKNSVYLYGRPIDTVIRDLKSLGYRILKEC